MLYYFQFYILFLLIKNFMVLIINKKNENLIVYYKYIKILNNVDFYYFIKFWNSNYIKECSYSLF